MTRVALCIKDLRNITLLADEKIPTVSTQLVPRDICEKKENEWVQFIPYVMFSYLDIASGVLHITSYKRPDVSEGEERLKGNLSVGFGGHVDNIDDIVHSDVVEAENGDIIYHMTSDDIKLTCLNTAKRELTEELGFDALTDLGVKENNIIFSLEREVEPNDVGAVHLCVLIKVALSEEQYSRLHKEAKPNIEEITDLKSISINVGEMLSSFNFSVACDSVKRQLTESNAEEWSLLSVNSLLTDLAVFISNNISFSSLFEFAVQTAKERQINAMKADEAPQDVVPVTEETVQ